MTTTTDPVADFLASRGDAWVQEDVNTPPENAEDADRRFRCPVLAGVMTGRQCAERHLSEIARSRSRNNAGLGHTYRGRCGECLSGAARAELLQVGESDLAAKVAARREELRRIGMEKSVEVDKKRESRRKAKAKADAQRKKPKTRTRAKPAAERFPQRKSKTEGVDLTLPIDKLVEITGLAEVTLRRRQRAAGISQPKVKREREKKKRRRLGATASAMMAGDWFTIGDLEDVLPDTAAPASALLRRWWIQGDLDRDGVGGGRRYRIRGSARVELKQQTRPPSDDAVVISLANFGDVCGRSTKWAYKFCATIVGAGHGYTIGAGHDTQLVVTDGEARRLVLAQIPPPQTSPSAHLARCFSPTPGLPLDDMLAAGCIAKTGRPGRGTSWLWWVVDGEAVDRHLNHCA